MTESEQTLQEEADEQIKTKIPSLYQFIIAIQYYRKLMDDITNNATTLNIDKKLMEQILETQKTNEYITNRKKFTEFTHMIIKIYQKLDNNTTFIITNDYPTTSITEETINKLKEEIETL